MRKKVGVLTERCVGCGICVRACPMGVMELEDGKTTVNQRRHCLECLHCTAACPTHAVTWEGLSEGECYPPIPEDMLERVILMRRSTRHFRPECPERALLEQVLDRAEYAPSSKNEHMNCWTVILGKEKTDALVPYVLEWGERNGRRELKIQAERGVNMMTCGAPCVIVGHIPQRSNNPEGDVVIAMTTAELLLTKAGLSACWGGYLKRTISATPELREKLGIPEDHLVAGVLLVGYADGEHYCNVPWRKHADIHFV